MIFSETDLYFQNVIIAKVFDFIFILIECVRSEDQKSLVDDHKSYQNWLTMARNSNIGKKMDQHPPTEQVQKFAPENCQNKLYLREYSIYTTLYRYLQGSKNV